MSVKLSTHHRNNIRKTLLLDKFAARREANKKRLQEIAERIYRQVFPEHLEAKLNEVPETWLPRVNQICFRVCAEHHMVDLDRWVRVPYEKLWNSGHTVCLVNLLPPDPIALAYVEYRDEKMRLEKEESKVSDEINAVLYSVTTANKLMQVWPEIKPLVERICGAPQTVNLPAPRVDHLNQLLGLKVA